jgi:hypothetical protein
MLSKAGEKGRRVKDWVNLAMEQSARAGDNVLKGRHIVWILLESFKTFDNSDITYGFDHLSRLAVQNHDPHDLVVQWNHVLDNMGAIQLKGLQLRDVFYRKIKDEPALAIDINHYERMYEDDPKKTYEHLLECVWSVNKVQGQRRNLLEKESLLLDKPSKRTEPHNAAPSVDKNKSEQSQRNRGGKGKHALPADTPDDTDKTNASGKGSHNQTKGTKTTDRPCWFYQKGECRAGTECKFSHIKASPSNGNTKGSDRARSQSSSAQGKGKSGERREKRREG